jgi:pimeloyl-ACP methyl ester carboxylesterase
VTRLRGRWLDRPWGRMRVWEAGRGQPILLVHGLGGSGRYFERLAARLDGRFRVVAPDLAGFGSSEKPKLGYERGAHLEDLDAVAERFGDRAPIVAGHSLGGLFAALWAARRPDAVRSLAIVAAPFPSPDEQAVWTHEPEVPAAARVTVPLAAATVRPLDGRFPIRLEHARDDRTVGPDAHERWRALLPSAEHRVVAGGHQAQLHDGFRALAGWVDGVAG